MDLITCEICGKTKEDKKSGSTGDEGQYCTCPGSKEQSDQGPLLLEPGTFPEERYEATKLIGVGASGKVYLARDIKLAKKVAIKTLHVLMGENLIAFQDEAKATSRLDHPNIIKILDFGSTKENVPYMVLDYFDATTLDEYLQSNKTLAWEQVKTIFLQLCSALEYAHSKRIFHRDIKPSNVMLEGVNQNGKLKVILIDFGVAKVTEMTGRVFDYQGNTIAGTPNYMSPDTVKGFKYSAASEIYSLGCVLFQCLTGKPPYDADSSLELMTKHVNDPVPKLKDRSSLAFSQDLEFLISKCLAKDPEQRFQSMSDVRKAIEEANSEPGELPSSEADLPSQETTEEDHTETNTPISKRNPKKWLMVSTLTMVILGAGIIYWETSKKPLNPTYQIPEEVIHSPNTYFSYNADDLKLTAYPQQNFDNKLVLVKNWPNALFLDLTKPTLTGTGFKSIVNSRIQKLELGQKLLYPEAFTYLGQMKNLRSLSMVNSNISGLKNLASAKELRELSLESCVFDYGELKFVLGIQNLEYLSIYTKAPRTIPADVFKKLSEADRLKYLSLSGNKPTLEQMKLLPKLTNLKMLYLENCGLTDEMVEVRARMNLLAINLDNKTIKEISMKKCRVTRNEFEAFNKKRPDIKFR